MFMNKTKVCKIDGCNSKPICRGYCKKHYQKFYQEGFFNKEIEAKKAEEKNIKCAVLGCNRPYSAKGYCHMHYLRVKNHGDPEYTETDFHGRRYTPEYKTWQGMKERCYNTNSKDYKNYGGRGITIYKPWRDSFMNFFQDMGIRPKIEYQIDRIDNDGNYEPGNCAWVPPLTNERHTRSTVLDMGKAREIRKKYAQGVRKCDLAIKYGCSPTNIFHVIKNNTWKEEAQA